MALRDKVVAKVQEQFGVELETEPQIFKPKQGCADLKMAACVCAVWRPNRPLKRKDFNSN